MFKNNCKNTQYSVIIKDVLILKKKVGIVSLGCPKNLVDSEIMLGLLQDGGYEITPVEEDANIIIVNTCGFIESAKKESVDTILQMSELKRKNCELLVVTGCLAERYKSMIMEELPEVDAVLGTGSYSDIAKVINKAFEGERLSSYGALEGTEYLNGKRLVSTNKGYAYLKIAEGCDNCCTYCIIPSLRGKYRSRRMEDLVEEAKGLAQQGSGEIILIAQDTTRYGTDIYGKKKLVELVRKISEIPEVKWVRLLYCYPEEIDNELVDEMAINEKVCKYLDIPFQHASDSILKRMGRRGRTEDNKRVIELLKTKVPGIVLRTSLIVGFPGENEEDFGILKEFVKEMSFDNLGVFTYSREEDTPAAVMKQQIPKKTKDKRYNEIMSIQKEIMKNKNLQRLEKEYTVLVEGVAEDGMFYYGRSYAEAPDIDGVIYFTSSEPIETGKFYNVRILSIDEYDLIGVVKDESAE